MKTLVSVGVAVLLAGVTVGRGPGTASEGVVVADDSGGSPVRVRFQPDQPGWTATGVNLEALARFGIKTVTRPSRDAVMGFSFPTQVREILVSGGDLVHKGDLLVRARDGEAVAALKMQEVRATNDAEVRGAKANVELAQLEFDSVDRLVQQGGGNKQEHNRARISLALRKAQQDAADYRFREQAMQVERLKADLERFHLKAPFDGTVDRVMVDVGRAVSNAEPVIRVVRVDPLWIDAPVPTEQTLSAAFVVGREAWVAMPLLERVRIVKGRVIEIGAVADAASGTRRVRIEVPNPGALPAGLTAWVRFSEPGPEWTPTAPMSDRLGEGES